MKQNDDAAADSEKDVQEIKKDFKAVMDRINKLKDKGSDIMKEQLHEFSDAITDLKNKGVKKGEKLAKELSSSTREHPLRNLACAFGLGALLTFIIK